MEHSTPEDFKTPNMIVNLTFERESKAVSTGLLHGLSVGFGSNRVGFHVVEHLLF
jgi:hypothetical protein